MSLVQNITRDESRDLYGPLVFASEGSDGYPSGMNTPNSDWDFTGSGAIITDRRGVMDLTVNEAGSPTWTRDANGLFLNAGEATQPSYNSDNYWEASGTTYNDMTSFTFYMDITMGATLKDIRDFFCIGSGTSNNGNNNSFKWTNGHSNEPDLYISQELNETIMLKMKTLFSPVRFIDHNDSPAGAEHSYVAKTIMNGEAYGNDDSVHYSLLPNTRYIMKISHVRGTRYRPSTGMPWHRGVTQIRVTPYADSSFSTGETAIKTSSTSMYNTNASWKLRSKTDDDRQLDYTIKTLLLYANKGSVHSDSHDDKVLTYLKGL